MTIDKGKLISSVKFQLGNQIDLYENGIEEFEKPSKAEGYNPGNPLGEMTTRDDGLIDIEMFQPSDKELAPRNKRWLSGKDYLGLHTYKKENFNVFFHEFKFKGSESINLVQFKSGLRFVELDSLMEKIKEQAKEWK